MDENKLILTFENEDGTETEQEFEVLISFRNKETGKCYVVYTDGVEDENGDIEIRASSYDPEDESNLYDVETDEEWAMIDALLDEIENSEEEEEE